MGKAFNEGWEASKKNIGANSNPYTPGTWDYRDWNSGFNSHNSFKLK